MENLNPLDDIENHKAYLWLWVLASLRRHLDHTTKITIVRITNHGTPTSPYNSVLFKVDKCPHYLKISTINKNPTPESIKAMIAPNKAQHSRCLR